jgi:hypothetical protein
MRNMWTKIGFGAFGIFALGMLLLTLLRDARASARDALLSLVGAEDASAATAPVMPEAPTAPVVAHPAPTQHLASLTAGLARLAQVHGSHGRDMPFILEGDRIGTIQRAVIRRSHKGELPEVSLEVVITDRAAAGRLAGCDLVPDHGTSMTGDDGFACADDTATDLVTVGTARLEPLGLTRPIRLSQDAAADMRDGDPFEVTTNAAGQVRVLAQGDHGGVVQVRADSGGAAIKIDDGLGRAIFRLLADSTGASMRVRGKDGRDVVRMDASGGTFSLTIDTTAAH